MAKTTAVTQEGAGKGMATGAAVNVAAHKANLASKLNFGPPGKGAPQQQPPTKQRGVLKPSSLGNTGRGNSQAQRVSPSKSAPNFAATRKAIAAQLNYTSPKPATPRPTLRAAPKPSHLVALDRSNDSAGNPSASGGADFAAQRSALASKLNFKPPRPAEPNHPIIQPPHTRPAPIPLNPVASRAGAGKVPQVQPVVVSEKVDFATHRAAIASKLTSVRHQAPPQNNPNRTQPSTRGPPVPAAANGAVVSKYSRSGTAKSADFAASSAALASKLNFGARPPPPRTNNQEAAQARAVAQPEKQDGRKEVTSGRVDMATQAASLASKLKFRPPRPASPKTNESVASNGQPPRQPWVPEPVQERLGPNANDRIHANDDETNQQARRQQMMAILDGVPMDPHIAAITQKLHLRNEDSRQREGALSPRSSHAHAPTRYDSVERYDAPRQTESKPEMQFIRSYSVSKLSPPPAAEIEPEMKYLRTYSVSKQPRPSQDQEQAPPIIEPFRQAIRLEPAVAKPTTVVLLDERYEWGTQWGTKWEDDNGGKSKRKKKKNKKKVTKLSTKKKKKGCTIM
jgi:hypothetical protein